MKLTQLFKALVDALEVYNERFSYARSMNRTQDTNSAMLRSFMFDLFYIGAVPKYMIDHVGWTNEENRPGLTLFGERVPSHTFFGVLFYPIYRVLMYNIGG